MKTGEIWLAQLDPTVGREIQKTMPCVVISPNEMNEHLRTVIVAPMTTGSRPAGFRVPLSFQGKHGLIVLDRIRTLDRARGWSSAWARYGPSRWPQLSRYCRRCFHHSSQRWSHEERWVAGSAASKTALAGRQVRNSPRPRRNRHYRPRSRSPGPGIGVPGTTQAASAVNMALELPPTCRSALPRPLCARSC